jgi:DNA polymerase-1
MSATDLEAWLLARGTRSGDDVGLAIGRDGIGIAVGSARRGFACDDPPAVIAEIEHRIGPRWVWWDRSPADTLVAAGVHVARCWDVLTVHRLLDGGWRTSVARAWAWLHGLPADTLPAMGQLGLLDQALTEPGDPGLPTQPDGHLRPDWLDGGWSLDPDRMSRWASLALQAATLQRGLLTARQHPLRALSTARAESAAELLCAELTATGLPFDVEAAERIIGESVGPRPRDERHSEQLRGERDAAVLAHTASGQPVDLRNPADVRAMLRREGFDLPDTRAWRLEQHRHHPLIDALLVWRKAERVATTYGYRWLDEHVRDGRLRGEWSSSDGAAGRMTASAGLHNLPAELRPAVAAAPGYVLVRADLGQIEPRVLAAVSGDPALIAATNSDDLYQPIADRLRVTREIAKVAVLGAMYGATTGTSAQALRGLERAYPGAMGLLERAAGDGRAGHDVFTIGGRRVRMWTDDETDAEGRGDIDRARSVAAARGRYARNAVIQGAAAELFKVWAVTVRWRLAGTGSEIVLCLHDELLVHTPTERGEHTSSLLAATLTEATHRWSPTPGVRFVAAISVVKRWSDVI